MDESPQDAPAEPMTAPDAMPEAPPPEPPADLPVDPPANPPSDPGERYFNRELSWLAFNSRVLAEAEADRFPLLERLRFLSISASNLDEFTMIRIAGLEGLASRGIEETAIDGRTPRQQLVAIRKKVVALEKRQQKALAALRRELDAEGIQLPEIAELSDKKQAWCRAYFESDILPLITPQAIDPSHPFPFVQNLGMGLIFRLGRPAPQPELMEMVLIPSGAPRFVRVPGRKAIYVAIEKLIVEHAELLFPGFEILGDGNFRVLRDSDMEVEEEAEDLVRVFRSAIQRRRRGRAVLLELDDECDATAETLLRDCFDIEAAMVVKSAGMLGLHDLDAICDEPRPDLKFKPFAPRYPERILEHDGDCFAAIREKDIVIHHPFESFDVVVDFLQQAAHDPAVVSIKQTLYRAGDQSPVIAALIEAALNGKAVTAVVELKARFDEERNLRWASELERAGVQVIYGIQELKTHAKVSLVVRREEEGYRTYCHFGTGNYHPVNAKIYTDLSYFTADAAYGRDAAKMFNYITGYVEPHDLELLAISPLDLREKLYALIEAETEAAREGRPAAIWLKMNSLTEQGTIDRLYQASQAGVQVVLVVRGICSLRAGVPGLSENITVKSIIGRFLEHTRIWVFGNGAMLPNEGARIYITSADAMSRNLMRRVEVAVPVTNRTVHDQVLDQVMLANILDTERSWKLMPDGEYLRQTQGPDGFNCHDYFMSNPSLSGRGAAIEEHDVPELSLAKRPS
ncbi:RNA degradosome polyphosphate kinase [Qipengyuania sp. MTN3-11]|uniref:RNA degradosome polyphosphate kinase n=1 Tax=Qipengyuania sp. MTN3-11 TaxID=3056557 RepID=UPI0036F3234F